MADPISPLAGVAVAGSFGAAAQAAVPIILSEKLLGAHWQVAGWRDFDTSVVPVLSALGFTGLGDYRTVRTVSDVDCYRIAPDRLWLMADDPGTLRDMMTNASAARLALLDLSHTRCVIGVSGAASEELLARVASLDFSMAAFPVGAFAQTGMHQISVLIRRRSADSFDILVPVTWAISLWQWFCVNAAPLGYAVETGAT